MSVDLVRFLAWVAISSWDRPVFASVAKKTDIVSITVSVAIIPAYILIRSITSLFHF